MASPDIELPPYVELEETWQDKAMHAGLFLGAIFMLICLLAVVFLPPISDEEIDRDLLLDSSESVVKKPEVAPGEQKGKKGQKAKWDKKKKR